MRCSTLLLLATALLGAPACSSNVKPAAQPAAAASRADEARALFERGRAAADQGDSVRAEQYITLAVDRGYALERALPLLLRVCLASSRLRAALDHAEPYLRDHPEAETLRYLVATIHLALGQRDAARLELQQLLRRNPESSDAHYLMGVLAADAEPALSRDHLRQYLELAAHGDHAAEVRSRLAELAIREEAGAKGEPVKSAEPAPLAPRWLDVRGPRAQSGAAASELASEGR